MTTKFCELDYRIDAKIIAEINATRKDIKRSRQGYGAVAGLCLLGEKDGIVDTIVPMMENNGCSGSPRISHAKFDEYFREMISKDRRVVGMAFVNTYSREKPYITQDLKINISKMRNSFADITKTIWIVTSAKSHKIYRTYRDRAKRVHVKETQEDLFINKEKLKKNKVVKKEKRDEITPIGNGLVLIKMPDGKEMLWTK